MKGFKVGDLVDYHGRTMEITYIDYDDGTLGVGDGFDKTAVMWVYPDQVTLIGVKVNRPTYEQLASEIGHLVDQKNAQYGDAINNTAEFLKVFWPDGIPVEQYHLLGIYVRKFDKMMRIANGHEEDSWDDLVGYDLLGKGLSNESSRK